MIGIKKYMTKKLLFLPFLLVIGGSCESSDDGLSQQDPIHLIYEFAPLTGSVGTEVVIHGMHFSEIPAENKVQFNNAEAEVIDAAYNKLTVKVPVKARTGKISITVRGITTVSTEEFVVK
jgi:hypothetical protein